MLKASWYRIGAKSLYLAMVIWDGDRGGARFYDYICFRNGLAEMMPKCWANAGA